jgi:hypothetical protein
MIGVVFKKGSWLSWQLLVLFGLMAVSIIFQLHNLSHYNVYPDSYQSLVVAKNLKIYHRLVATMGQNGITYPSYFAWTRPVYPILITVFSYLGFSLETSAHIIATSADMLSLLSIYFLVKTVLKSSKSGLVAAALLTFSYAHTVWSGFILTEPLGVLMLSLALLSLVKSRKGRDDWLETRDIYTGLLFAAAILTRYEYIAILIPAAFIASPKLSLKRSLTILGLALASSFAVLVALQAFAAGWLLAWQQFRGDTVALLIEVLLLVVVIAAINKRKDLVTAIKWLSYFTASLIVLASLALVIRHSIYTGMWLFVKHNFLIGIFAVLGLVSLLLKDDKKSKQLGLALSSGCLILGVCYYHTNPTMERYVVHLLPLLLIAAACGVQFILKFKYRIAIGSLLLLLLCFQSVISWRGLHGVEGNIWFKPGYEELVAKKLAPIFGANKTVVTALPEPYYLYTKASVQSVTNSAPYVYLNYASHPSQTVYLVDDLPLQELFPNAARVLSKKLNSYQILSGIVNVPFRYTDKITYTSIPLKVYKVKANQLQYLIKG